MDDSDAYRQAYDTGYMAPATIHREAHALANHPKIATALAAARVATGHEAQIRAQDLITKLQGIADAPIQEPVRASDKIAAVREIGRLAGLYREDQKDPNQHPINITHVTVVLSHGETEEREVGSAVVEGESHVSPGDEADSHA